VRNDGVRTARNREFEQEFIAWVRQGWPQPEVDRGLAAEETERPDNPSTDWAGIFSNSASRSPMASYSRIRGTEIRGLHASPIMRRIAKDAPRWERSAETTTFVSRTTNCIRIGDQLAEIYLRGGARHRVVSRAA
jgi:hypothetical protein